MKRRLPLLLCLGIFFSASGMAQEKGQQPMEAKATFAGGCFWCMQPFFDRTKGVIKTMVGYTGGHVENPTYEEVSSGETGHAEAIEITYDPSQVTYEHLLDIFWRNIDPTARDAQFVDHGTQYRSAVFYHDEAQKKIAEASRKALSDSGKFDGPIETQIVAATTFYPAEDYHQAYYKKSPQRYQMYHDNTGREEFKEKYWGKEQ